jgi:hypothetical protein
MTLWNENQPIMGQLSPSWQIPQRHRDPKFERHIEPGQLLITLAFTSRQVVNGVFRGEDGSRDVLHSGYRYAPTFQGAPRQKCATGRREHDGIEQAIEISVEGAIDEDGS